MAQRIQVGIDIGTYQIKVAIAEASSERDRHHPRVLGVGFAESKGMRHGYIINQGDAVRAIHFAVEQAQKTAGIRIKKAYLALGGIGLAGVTSQGSIAISRADSEITDLDVEKALKASEEEIPKAAISNRKIIHVIPVQYKVDGKPVLGRPHGMKGMKLEVRTLFITCLEHHVNDLIQAVEEIGIEVEDVVAAPLAASIVTTTKLQKMAGCVLANIGAETTSIVVFENNIPVSLEVFNLGSTDITNDIALGLKIPLEEAEEIKLGNSLSNVSFSKKKFDEIVEARLSDIFELIEGHLKKIGRSELLPAGIIMTGGGSMLSGLQDFARSALKLPAKIATYNMSGNFKSPIKDSTWSVAYGLTILGFSASEDEQPAGIKLVKRGQKNIVEWIKQFLP